MLCYFFARLRMNHGFFSHEFFVEEPKNENRWIFCRKVPKRNPHRKSIDNERCDGSCSFIWGAEIKML